MGPWKWTLCVSLLVCCVDGSASNNQTAKPGDDVTLQCLGPRGAEILAVKWTRPDLKEEEGYVFFFRNNRPYENYQHPSFRGRVKLIDPELKDGNCSVILKNVRINDTGTYKCLVGMKNNPDMSVHNISLTVTDSHPDQTAKPGDDVTLQCLGSRGAEILLVKWTRPDLKEEEGDIFYFRENRFQEHYLHPSFRGRVKLINPELKDEDFSVILKNVRIDDTGTYECHVGMKNNPEISVHTISLTVTDPDPDQTAKPGDDVTLQCLESGGAEILLVKWTRPDLKEKKKGDVFYFKNNRLYEKYQHPSFRGRVKLRDPELKDGDCSVILKNVRIDDTGTYECHVRMRNNPDMSVHNISLMVTDSHPGSTGGRTGEGGAKEGEAEDGGDTDRNLGLAVGLGLSVVAVVLGVVGFLIYRKYKRMQRAELVSTCSSTI